MSVLVGLTTTVPAAVLELRVTCKYCLMMHEVFIVSFTCRMQYNNFILLFVMLLRVWLVVTYPVKCQFISI